MKISSSLTSSSFLSRPSKRQQQSRLRQWSSSLFNSNDEYCGQQREKQRRQRQQQEEKSLVTNSRIILIASFSIFAAVRFYMDYDWTEQSLLLPSNLQTIHEGNIDLPSSDSFVGGGNRLGTIDNNVQNGTETSASPTIPRWKCQDWDPWNYHNTVRQRTTTSPSQSPPPGPPQLLGILLVGKADIYTIDDWLYRHIALFEKLVVVDGSQSIQVERSLLQPAYREVIQRITDDELNLTRKTVSDQTLRGPAMKILGNPVGCFVMICHPDEFWMLDPREVASNLVWRERWRTIWWWRYTPWYLWDPTYYTTHNVIRVRVLTASPFESDYITAVKQLKQRQQQISLGRHEENGNLESFVSSSSRNMTAIGDNNNKLNDSSFHIVDLSRWTHPSNSTVNKQYKENRIVLWEDGMEWGTRHSLVVPEHMPAGCRIKTLHDVFMIHFKLHDLSPNAFDWTVDSTTSSSATQFKNTRLRTGLHDEQDGWRGYFLDQSEQSKLMEYPPQPIEEAIEERCKGNRFLTKQGLKCVVPWSTTAKFS